MHKFTILFVVLCAVIAVSAIPARRTQKKSVKIMRHAPKSGKLVRHPMKAVRRNGKYEIHAAGNTVAGINFAEPKSFELDEPVADDFPETFADVEFEQDAPEADVTFFEDEAQYDVAVQDEVAVEQDVPQVKNAASAGNYFSTHFGKANDGSIALANSYSTGQKGSSVSTATSHGAGKAQYY